MRLFPIILCATLAGCQNQATPVGGSKPTGGPAPSVEADGGSSSAPMPITLAAVDREGFEKVLASKRGNVVLIDAWATWCAPCKELFKHTVDLHKKYSPQGLAVISLSLDDEEAHAEALAFLKEQGANFTNLRSTWGAEDMAIEQFDIDGGSIPHFKLYDRQGKLVKKFVSGDPDKVFTPEEVELAVRQLVQQDKTP